MKALEIEQDPQVNRKFESYPPAIRKKLIYLNDLIVEVADEMEGNSLLEVSLKWGEPSYKVKKGSPIRIDWKAKDPDQYAMYFVCTTSLVETFRMVYGNLFRYGENRALLFALDDQVPVKELKDCISMALNYQALKDIPFLGR